VKKGRRILKDLMMEKINGDEIGVGGEERKALLSKKE